MSHLKFEVNEISPEKSLPKLIKSDYNLWMDLIYRNPVITMLINLTQVIFL